MNQAESVWCITKGDSERRGGRRRQDEEVEESFSAWRIAEGSLREESMGPGAMARSLGHFYEDRPVQLGEEDKVAELSVFRVRGTLDESYLHRAARGWASLRRWGFHFI